MNCPNCTNKAKYLDTKNNVKYCFAHFVARKSQFVTNEDLKGDN